jgi:hypothetical protein
MGMRQSYLGSIFTDVAAIIVGDPCKVLEDKRYPGQSIRYQDFVNKEINSKNAIVVYTLEGCDGWCNVFVEKDKDGNAIRLIIDLSPKVRPGIEF